MVGKAGSRIGYFTKKGDFSRERGRVFIISQ